MKSEQSYVVKAGDSDKKKKKRSNLRSKQNPSVPEVERAAHNSLSVLVRNDGTQNARPLPIASDVAFNSVPTMRLADEILPFEGSSTQNQQLFSPKPNGGMVSKSCPVTIACDERSPSHLSNGFIPQDSHQRNVFAPHWSTEAVNEALEKGHAFKALFRVNAHNKLEAYCKIDGIQTDVLINGVASQNRAVEGDIVAIVIDPLSSWIRMKGIAGVSNNFASPDDCDPSSNALELVGESCKGKDKVGASREYVNGCTSRSSFPEKDLDVSGYNGFTLQRNYSRVGRHSSLVPDPSKVACEQNDVASSVEKLCTIISSFPSKRPTGRVVSIVERSPHRDAVVGFLNAKHFLSRERLKKVKNANLVLNHTRDYVMLIPNDPKFTKMMVSVGDLPSSIIKRLEEGDATIEKELVGAWIEGWGEKNFVPQARVVHIFGRGGEIEAHTAAIFFENGVNISEFSPESLSCLPPLSWKIPPLELQNRIDLRNSCVFTIDPSTATDLDDALSVERLPNGVLRVGVHIADASYFVLPETELDREAQVRSTSVYLSRRKLPMLPSLLSENLGSLNPGVDRLAFSMFWDMNDSGEIMAQWIGRTIIRSCCKLSYENVQDIIDGLFVETGFPQLHGNFRWSDICGSIRSLLEISRNLKRKRFSGGALRLDSPKLHFILDKDGIPYESKLSESKDSNFLVEEFMLLANTTAAEVIYRAYPDCALLRRHPEPNLRKLSEFEAFCIKHGFKLDVSSSSQFHNSLEQIKESLGGDPVLFNILVNYATKSMQLAKYFSSAELKDSADDWGHYALGVPLYTHFTSPLRRYADIVVHRTLAAAIEAEDTYLKLERTLASGKDERNLERNCFSGKNHDKLAVESSEGKAVLSAAASKHKVPCTGILVDIAAHCNERKLACRKVKDACNRFYMWFILKKEILLTEARVLALGPRFMSIYVPKLAIERRIYYDDIEDLVVEWLDATSTLLLSLSTKRSQKRGSHGKCRILNDFAHITSPLELELDIPEDCGADSEIRKIEPAVFPLTVSLLSTITVALHALGGDDGPVDIGARLYISTYLR